MFDGVAGGKCLRCDWCRELVILGAGFLGAGVPLGGLRCRGFCCFSGVLFCVFVGGK